MWIFDRVRVPFRLAQWAGPLGAFAFAFLPELTSARASAESTPHLGWIGVLVLAARDGTKGLLVGLVAAATGVAAGLVVKGVAFANTGGGLDTGSNLIAFAACLAVSWIASWHLRRHADDRERIRTLSERAAETRATTEGLKEAVGTLRARADRTWTSLSFLRDVAARFHGGDPVAAAQAAADLALARTGASAVAVHVGPRGFQRLLAVRDARGPEAFSRLEPRDADLIVPVGDYPRVGTLALWGLASSGVDPATARDLETIAAWCAPALTATAWQHGPAGQSRSLA